MSYKAIIHGMPRRDEEVTLPSPELTVGTLYNVVLERVKWRFPSTQHFDLLVGVADGGTVLTNIKETVTAADGVDLHYFIKPADGACVVGVCVG